MSPQTRLRVAFAVAVGGTFAATLVAVAWKLIDGPYWTGGTP